MFVRALSVLQWGVLVGWCLASAYPLMGQTGMQHVFGEIGAGFSSNPQFSSDASAAAMWSRRAGLSGDRQLDGVALQWLAIGSQTAFPGSDFRDQTRFDGVLQVEKSLAPAVRTGVDVAANRGVALEQDWRGREAWLPFERSLWQGTWWLELMDRGRKGRMQVERGGAAYSSRRGYSQGTFRFGAEMEVPVYGKVRGKLGLQKVGQSRTQHAGSFAFSLNHTQQNFHDWKSNEGALAVFDFLRADAVSIREGDGAHRMWLTTELAAGYAFPAIRGLQSGIQFVYEVREDAGVGSYDCRASEAQIWFETEQERWNLRGTAGYAKNALMNQQIFGENRWAAYAFDLWNAEARTEVRMATDWRLFVACDARGMVSAAAPVGWYLRSSWQAWTAQFGVVWIRSDESKWERRHAQLLRLQTKPPEFTR